MWFNHKFFKYATGTVLVLLIILLLGKTNYILSPIKTFVAVLFFPILISGMFYYLLRPLVNLAVRFHVPRTLAILISFLLIIGAIVGIGTYAGSLIWGQLNQLINDLPKIVNTLTDKAIKLIDNNDLGSVVTGKIQQEFASYLQDLVPFVRSSILGAVSTVTNVMTILVIVPFIVFYMLKDDGKFSKSIIKLVPKKYENEVGDIIEDTDKTLSNYITGKAIIALILGVMMYIGYMIIGLKYAFILAIFVLITSFIPMFGAMIGIIPAMLVALAYSPSKAVWVFIIMVIVQQLEGNLISPLLIGKRMDMHPLTLILLFMAAAALYGFVGMLICVPTYAVLKIVIKGAYKIYMLRKIGSSSSFGPV